jgi:iron complex transport system permease protein
VYGARRVTVLGHPNSPAARRAAGLVACLALLALCVLASIAIGSRATSLGEVLRAFSAYDGSDEHVIVRELRVPRTELGLLVGAALGAAGALMQGVTRNPLAEPGILGINAGAAFAVVLAIALLGVGSATAYAAVALAGAALTAVAIFSLAGRGAAPVRLALAGAVLATLLVSLTSAVLVFDARTLDEFRFWIVGSLAGRDAGVVLSVLPFIVAGLAGLGFVLLAGGAVAAAGPVAFVGLAVPHVARSIAGPDYRWIVPYSIVLGACLLLAGDVAGRMVVRPGELEVGIVTALLGAPFFIWLVRRRRAVAL